MTSITALKTRIKKHRTKKQWKSGVLLCLLALTGCGGGGSSFGSGGSGAANTTSNGGSGGTVLTGTVQSANGSPLPGYRVVYDQTSDLTPGQGAGLTTTTNSQGQFTFHVPASQITGNDLVFIYDATDSLVGKATVVPGGTAAVITILPPTPPAPPGQTALPAQMASG